MTIIRLHPRLDLLPSAQQRLWTRFRGVAASGFVLYGGTAIALRLGHRISVDFDFFTDRPLNKNELYEKFEFLPHAVVLQEQHDTLTVLANDGLGTGEEVKVSFFSGLDFGRVGEPEMTDDGILQIASLDDLMATKLKVMLQRVEAKDYADVAAMIRAGVSLAKGLASARQMYGSQFQPSESLKALTYFEGGDLHALARKDAENLIAAASAVRNMPEVHILARALAR